MIRLENVNKYFNYRKKNEIHVIDNTSLELPDKGLVALLGPSGCGKTTLLNAIGGLDKVKNGKIFINDKKITRKTSGYIDKVRNLNVGYIFQNYYLVSDKTVYDNVALSLKMIGIKDKEEIKKRVTYVLETLGLYRYRNRPCNMLSGGERQRVGIARAIVKNPNIIIADEPTGNLDSANTIEIMNIIKSISKERLVLLVTHENDIAKFYADRILEIEDGKIVKDYENKHNDNLDYRMENKIYLKDFKHITNFENKDNIINIYNDKQNDIKLNIVVKNNNIYIKGGKNDKIEVIDENSNIEFINDHYKEIDKSVYEKYEFNFDSIIDKNKKLKYSSIFNPITMITGGFKKLLDYSIIKKILLLGFLASGAFIFYAVSNFFGVRQVKDEYFIARDPHYYASDMAKIKVDRYETLEKLDSVNYIIPGNSKIGFKMSLPYYYQTMNSMFLVNGSMVSNEFLESDNIIHGKMPKDKYDIVIDKMVIERMEKYNNMAKQAGVLSMKDYLNKPVTLKNMEEFTIVGISDNKTPSIYVNKDLMINIIDNKYTEESMYGEDSENGLIDYNLIKDVTLTKGRMPEKKYEVIAHSSNDGMYELYKKIDDKVNGEKLLVVGFYNSTETKSLLATPETIKIKVIEGSKNIMVVPKDNDKAIEDFNENKANLYSTYDKDKDNYKHGQKTAVTAGMTASVIILAISFVEIYLMVRASFLSRIKEIGIYRAIGVKKRDIYKMFFGEIVAITTIACVPGILFVAYAIKNLSVIDYVTKNYLVNPFTIILSIILVYVFNIIVGLLPVANVIRKTPAQILARKDLD